MSDAVFSEYCLMLVRSVETNQPLYSLGAAARLTGVHADMIQHYCQSGLLGEAHSDLGKELVFDDSALFELRRIEDLRRVHGVNLRALPLVCSMVREIEQLRTELRFLRAR